MMVVMMIMMMVLVLHLLMAQRHGPLASTAPALLLDEAAETLTPPLLLVPRAQRFAAKCQVIIFNDGSDHPGVQADIHLDARRSRQDEGWLNRTIVA